MEKSKTNQELTYFDILNNVNVNEYTETRRGSSKELTYLTWSAAIAEVTKKFPDMTYNIFKFGEKNLPYIFDEETGYMVWTSVTIQNVTKEMWLPVMDSANNTMRHVEYEIKTKNASKIVKKATMFDINKTIMRCLTKNFGVFGLGLYIYAGSDLPEEEEIQKKIDEKEQKDKEIKAVSDIRNIDNIIKKLLEQNVAKEIIVNIIKSYFIIDGVPSANFKIIKDNEISSKILEELTNLFNQEQTITK